MSAHPRPSFAAFALAVLPAIVLIAACGSPPAYEPVIANANAARGGAAIEKYQCGACHVIPGVSGARGRVGPPLDTFAKHSYIAGRFPNTPAHLIRWLQDPPSMAPRTAMPNVGVSGDEARDIAAFLYALE